ncbi:FUSC family protein [Streptomyces sp. TS71-3]|uniref:FUSC family protein n=1 Tax=Streptomyces sp. TS71-3 TaxID=2733862 RepID=UPI001B15BEDF|nr:FUSC family protein [Streptomyces sp. TS71-3]GHJ42171.1 FUSC family protein [Streptomyces sp. TS71-3]
MKLLEALRRRDPDLAALRRSCRAGIVAPGTFALADRVIGNPTMGLFASFCSISGLLFVDFSGRVRQRVAQQAALVLCGAVLVCLGTLASTRVWLAALVTLAVGFAVLFAGVVSSALAAASTALLAGLILSVSLPASVDAIPERLEGWLLAGAASVAAVGLLWPAPEREPMRLATVRACDLLARRLRAEAGPDAGAGERGGDGTGPTGGAENRRAAPGGLAREAADAVRALRHAYFRAPYRPTGLSMEARMLVRLIDQVVWLADILDRTPAGHGPMPADPAVHEVRRAAADLLEEGARELRTAAGDPPGLREAARRLAAARADMAHTVVSALPLRSSAALAGEDQRAAVAGFVNSLEPDFRAHEMSTAVSAMAETIALTVAAYRRSWWQRLLGRRPPGVPSALESAGERAGAHVEPHSVWLHNSIRGAVALALAVTVAQLLGVQHAFWAVFGALAVLRSNAVLTGENAVRGLAGTVAGIIVGGALIVALGPYPTGSWLLFPLAVLFTGLAPATISFAAGQAGFTVTLLILFDIIAPMGWHTGLIRIEDVAIGCGVSLLAGALFWPRGAVTELGRVLAEAFAASARYLRSTVDYAVARYDAHEIGARAARDEQRRAAAAARRLDDAWRGFLVERGTKHLPLADVTALITAVAVLRLTADAILGLWSHEPAHTAGAGAARGEMLRAGALLADWYQRTAHALAGYGRVPGRLSSLAALDSEMAEAVRSDLARTGRATPVPTDEASRTAVKVVWTADHLDVARRIQVSMAEPARIVAEYQRDVATGSRRPTLRRQPPRSKRA